MEFPFNVFFLKFLVIVRNFLRSQLRRYSFGVLSAKELGKLVEDFHTLVDFLNDFLTIEDEKFHRFFANSILSFIVADLIQLVLVRDMNPHEKGNDLLLTLTLLFDRLKNVELKKHIFVFLFSEKVAALHTELFLNSLGDLEQLLKKYFIDKSVNLKAPLIASQLVQVYEKHFAVKFDGISNISFNDAAKSANDVLSKTANSDEKALHLILSQRTGVVSYLPWTKDLVSHALSDPISLCEEIDVSVDNQLRMIFFSSMVVNSSAQRLFEKTDVVVLHDETVAQSIA